MTREHYHEDVYQFIFILFQVKFINNYKGIN